MENFADDFRANVRYYREKQGMSQSQLSVQADCSMGMIGIIEAGKARPSFDMVLKLAAALRIHPADLFLRDASVSRTALKAQLQDRLISDIQSLLEEHFPE